MSLLYMATEGSPGAWRSHAMRLNVHRLLAPQWPQDREYQPIRLAYFSVCDTCGHCVRCACLSGSGQCNRAPCRLRSLDDAKPQIGSIAVLIHSVKCLYERMCPLMRSESTGVTARAWESVHKTDVAQSAMACDGEFLGVTIIPVASLIFSLPPSLSPSLSLSGLPSVHLPIQTMGGHTKV